MAGATARPAPRPPPACEPIGARLEDRRRHGRASRWPPRRRGSGGFVAPAHGLACPYDLLLNIMSIYCSRLSAEDTIGHYSSDRPGARRPASCPWLITPTPGLLPDAVEVVRRYAGSSGTGTVRCAISFKRMTSWRERGIGAASGAGAARRICVILQLPTSYAAPAVKPSSPA